MPYLLRMVRRSRWEHGSAFPWLDIDDVQADALQDLVPKGNSLSFYEVPDQSGPDPIVFALAANRDNFANFDYVVVAADELESLGIVINETMGLTPWMRINRLHRDVAQLSVKRVSGLVSVAAKNLPIRMNLKVVKAGVVNAVKDGHMAIDQVNENLRAKIIEDLNRDS